MTWIMGLISLQPGCACTGGRAPERGLWQEPSTVPTGKSLAVPASGYPASWGYPCDQQVAPHGMHPPITLGSTSAGTSRACQGRVRHAINYPVCFPTPLFFCQPHNQARSCNLPLTGCRKGGDAAAGTSFPLDAPLTPP